MSKVTVETITCDRCGKTKEIVDGNNPFDRNNVFHYDIVNPTNKKEEMDFCHECFCRLRIIWEAFMFEGKSKKEGVK